VQIPNVRYWGRHLSNSEDNRRRLQLMFWTSERFCRSWKWINVTDCFVNAAEWNLGL
jgi:hypothetical protein